MTTIAQLQEELDTFTKRLTAIVDEVRRELELKEAKAIEAIKKAKAVEIAQAQLAESQAQLDEERRIIEHEKEADRERKIFLDAREKKLQESTARVQNILTNLDNM